MRRFIFMALALTLIFSLCACGKTVEEPETRDCGLYIKLEANDIYTVSCGTDDGSQSSSNADGTPFTVGSVVHFDFAGEAAEASGERLISYSVCIYDKDVEIIAAESFVDDFGGMAKVELTVTADHNIIREGEVISCGGEVIVDFFKTSVESPAVNAEYAEVAIQDAPEAAEKINARISELTKDFTETQANANYDAYTQYLATLETEEAKAAAVQFGMLRSVSLGRYDKAAVSFRISDTVAMGSETDGTLIHALSFDSETGEEISFDSLSSDPQKLREYIIEDILIRTTEEERFTAETMAFTDGYTSVIPTLITDGNWYFSPEGLVIIVNAGTISDKSYGSFEFTLPYSDISKYLDEKFIPAEPEGETGSVELKPLKGFDANSVTPVREISGEDGIVLCVSGNVYNVSIRDYATSKQIVCCSDISEGGALAVNCTLKLFEPSVILSYTTPDGEVHKNAVSLGVTGEIELGDADVKIYKGNVITTQLPYCADLNADGEPETIDLSVAETGSALTVTAGGNEYSLPVSIKSDAVLRLRDMDSDGKTELFLEGILADDTHGIYIFRFDTELALLKYGENDHINGYVKQFENEKLIVSEIINMLGSYKVRSSYVLNAAAIEKPEAALTTFNDNTKSLTLKSALTSEEGLKLAAGDVITVIAAKGSELIYYVDANGAYGSLKLGINEAGHWAVCGIDEVDCFENIVY